MKRLILFFSLLNFSILAHSADSASSSKTDFFWGPRETRNGPPKEYCLRDWFLIPNNTSWKCVPYAEAEKVGFDGPLVNKMLQNPLTTSYVKAQSEVDRLSANLTAEERQLAKLTDESKSLERRLSNGERFTPIELETHRARLSELKEKITNQEKAVAGATASLSTAKSNHIGAVPSATGSAEA